jgi:hypothetical protein
MPEYRRASPQLFNHPKATLETSSPRIEGKTTTYVYEVIVSPDLPPVVLQIRLNPNGATAEAHFMEKQK